MYATFAEDLTGFFGKWTLHAHAPRSKRLGSPEASKHSGRVNAATVSPIREPKWTDQTDEEDEDLFSEYFVDGGVTPTPKVEPSAGTAPPGGRTGREVNLRVPGARAARRTGLAARSAAKSVRGLTGKVARGIVNALSGRSSVFDFKVFKLFTFVLNVTLGTFEIPRQIILIPLIVGSRLSLVPDWLLATFESDSIVDAKASSRREKNKPEVVFPKLRWNALKTWENAMQSGRVWDKELQKKSEENEETPEIRDLIEKLMEEGRAYDRACDSEKSQQAFERAMELRPKDAVIMYSLSKELSDRVFDHEIFHNKALARQFASRAGELATQAIELAPNDAKAYTALAVANARLSMFTEARQKVELTHAIKSNLVKALEIEPNNDDAYHVLARFEHTMAHIGGFTRYLIRKIYGAIEPATIEKAEEYFRRAIEIAPKRLIHGVELAKLLYETKRYDECKQLLLTSLEYDIEDINSVRTKKDGETLLRKVAGKLNRTPSRGKLNRTPSRGKLNRTPSRLSLSRTPSKLRAARAASSSSSTPMSRTQSRGSGLFDSHENITE